MAPLRLQYAEQPCATVEELVELRKRLAEAGVAVPIAADESIRRAEDLLRVPSWEPPTSWCSRTNRWAAGGAA